MSDSRFVAESIEEMLVALAAGVREAQEALGETNPHDRFGRPLPTYHIPYLDFQISVEMETERQEGTGRPILRLIKLPRDTGTSNEHSRTSSSISGRFVAVPPGEGLPVPTLRLSAEAIDARTRRIAVQLSNSAGELLAGHRVEMNIDPPASDQLSRLNGAGKSAPQTGTQLTQAVLVTDEQGEAATTLNLAAEDAKALIVVTAQVGITTTRISVMAGRAS